MGSGDLPRVLVVSISWTETGLVGSEMMRFAHLVPMLRCLPFFPFSSPAPLCSPSLCLVDTGAGIYHGLR